MLVCEELMNIKKSYNDSNFTFNRNIKLRLVFDYLLSVDNIDISHITKNGISTFTIAKDDKEITDLLNLKIKNNIIMKSI
jgi:hypothetical protein